MCATRATAWPPHAPNRPRHNYSRNDNRRTNNRRPAMIAMCQQPPPNIPGHDARYPYAAARMITAAPTFPAMMTAARITAAAKPPPAMMTATPTTAALPIPKMITTTRMTAAAPNIPGIDATARMTPPQHSRQR